jgi:hypothetical protein
MDPECTPFIQTLFSSLSPEQKAALTKPCPVLEEVISRQNSKTEEDKTREAAMAMLWIASGIPLCL